MQYLAIIFLIILAYGRLEKKISDLETRVGGLEYGHKDEYESEADSLLLDEIKKRKKRKIHKSSKHN